MEEAMKLDLTLARKGFILIAVPLAFELIFVSVLLLLLRQAELETEREAHSKAIYSTSNSVARLFLECASMMILYGGTHSDVVKARYILLKGQIPRQLAELKMLVQGNLRQEQTFVKANAVADKIL